MRYAVRSGKGGKDDRFFVWDNNEKRVLKGKMEKQDAIELEHSLNGRKFLDVDSSQIKFRIPWYEVFMQKIRD